MQRHSAKVKAKVIKCQQDKSYTQVNRSQQEDPVDDGDGARMTVLSPGMYGHHQFNTVEQQQMAYLKNQTRSQTFNQLQSQPFLIQLGD